MVSMPKRWIYMYQLYNVVHVSNLLVCNMSILVYNDLHKYEHTTSWLDRYLHLSCTATHAVGFYLNVDARFTILLDEYDARFTCTINIMLPTDSPHSRNNITIRRFDCYSLQLLTHEVSFGYIIYLKWLDYRL